LQGDNNQGEDTMSNQILFKYLEKSLQGSLVRQGDSNYDRNRAIWNGRIDRKPMAIARCKNTSDVIASVNFARDHQLLISIRGGGHHTAGHAVCDGGLMIDLSLMDQVHADPKGKTVQVGRIFIADRGKSRATYWVANRAGRTGSCRSPRSCP
jgi:hypothetical protein